VRLTRRHFLAALVPGGALSLWLLRKRVLGKLSAWTRLPEFTATPPLVPHDPVRDRAQITVAQGGSPGDNVDAVLARRGGIEAVVGPDDVVLVKVSAQWWNQGMTNVAAVKRLVERVLARPGFHGEVIVFENVHFRLADGSGLARAWTRPSERNVDVPGWTRLGDLVEHFAGQAVSFVGLVDGGSHAEHDSAWHDEGHAHGWYGGDGRGPIAAGEERDGYRWDFDDIFSVPRSRVDAARTPLTWPVFTSPRSGVTVDLRDGLYRRVGGKRGPVTQKLTWITMTTANEHPNTGYTGCCKSAMGIVDMSAGRLGTDPRIRDYQSVHHFGAPDAMWRMGGPLAHFARRVRRPNLYLTVAEWVASTPAGAPPDSDTRERRLAADCARQLRTVVAGTDPVAMDTWVVRHLLMPLGGADHASIDLDSPDSTVVKFLRSYRQVGGGTMDERLIEADVIQT
jgi:hypothetical protein